MLLGTYICLLILIGGSSLGGTKSLLIAVPSFIYTFSVAPKGRLVLIQRSLYMLKWRIDLIMLKQHTRSSSNFHRTNINIFPSRSKNFLHLSILVLFHVVATSKIEILHISNHDNDGNKNVANLHIWQWKTAFFLFWTFRSCSRSFHVVEWSVFQLCGGLEPIRGWKLNQWITGSSKKCIEWIFRFRKSGIINYQ